MQALDEKSRQEIIEATRIWLERAVIGLNLCPFAKAVHVKRQIRYVVSNATTKEDLDQHLQAELIHLHAVDPAETDTTLLIHPFALVDFYDYNAFLETAEASLEALGLGGELQIASFHPDYQFADANANDITNYTNRAPFPILHLLREASVERAIKAVPEAREIYERNMETLRLLGHDGWMQLFARGDELP